MLAKLAQQSDNSAQLRNSRLKIQVVRNKLSSVPPVVRKETLLLLLSCRTHLLLESSVRDLEASQSLDTNTKNADQNDRRDNSHEDACKRSVNGISNMLLELLLGIPGVKNWYFSNSGSLSQSVSLSLRRTFEPCTCLLRSICTGSSKRDSYESSPGVDMNRMVKLSSTVASVNRSASAASRWC